jgi:hypothetical protein
MAPAKTPSKTPGKAPAMTKAAEIVMLQQQLEHAAQLAAVKEELLQQKDALIAELRGQPGAAGTASQTEHHTKKARFAPDDSTIIKSPLDKDATLDAVFGFVGIGEYAYAAGVNRRWRGRYIKLYYNKAAPGKKESSPQPTRVQ